MTSTPTLAPAVRRTVCLAVVLALAGCHSQSGSSTDKWTTVDASADHGDSGPVTFAGEWEHLGRHVDNGAAGSRSSHAGDEVVFHFNGTQIRLYSDTDPTCGYGVVLIDGAMVPDRVDFYSSTLRSHALVYTSPVLDSGGHTLIVQVSGVADGKGRDSYVDIDDAQILAVK